MIELLRNRRRNPFDPVKVAHVLCCTDHGYGDDFGTWRGKSKYGLFFKRYFVAKSCQTASCYEDGRAPCTSASAGNGRIEYSRELCTTPKIDSLPRIDYGEQRAIRVARGRRIKGWRRGTHKLCP